MNDCNTEVMQYQLKDLMEDKKNSSTTLRWAGGLAFSAIIVLASYANGISKDLTIASTRIESLQKELEKVRKVNDQLYKDLGVVQDWVEANYVRKE